MCDIIFDVFLWLFFQILPCFRILYVCGDQLESHLFTLGDGGVIEKDIHTFWAVNVSQRNDHIYSIPE